MDKIAVIGAGMAGLSAARSLQAAGLVVTVFDKSRGVGGRLATRRTETGSFDHGAPLVHGNGIPEFADAMDDLPSAEAQDDGWRGLPGMSGLLKPWLDGALHHLGTQIARIDGRRLIDTGGNTHGPFDAIIVAIPAPQATELTGAPALRGIEMVPLWTILAAWTTACTAPSAPDPLSAVIAQRGDHRRWIAHATDEWSRENLERDKSEVAQALVDPLARVLGLAESPIYLAAHRWRFARIGAPLGQPFVDCGDNILAGGDWALGPLAGHAFVSGRAMADEISARALSGA